MLDIKEKLHEIGPYVEAPDDELLVCRCEEVTKGEIRRAVHEGITTIEEMRRYLRNGMGLCQGQTCGNMVCRIMAQELRISLADMTPATARVPMRPIEMNVAAIDGGFER